MKILVIHTGGTIASSYSPTSPTLKDNKAFSLADDFTDIDFTQRLLMNVLSENMELSKINEICRALYEAASKRDHDGIILTHGSDTLSYTAAFCEQMLGGTPVPIILTAADHPLEDPISNGRDNFKAAVEIIKAGKPGVYVAWKNQKEPTFCCHGGNICEADPYSDSFSCFMPEEKYVPCDRFEFIPLEKQVLLIRCYPSIDFRCYEMKSFSAAVIYLYHSATAPTEGEGSICEFIKRCRKKSKNIYLASIKKGVKIYETAENFLSLGGISIYDSSVETAYAKAVIRENRLTKL